MPRKLAYSGYSFTKVGLSLLVVGVSAAVMIFWTSNYHFVRTHQLDSQSPLLIRVTDASNGKPIIGATVAIYGQHYANEVPVDSNGDAHLPSDGLGQTSRVVVQARGFKTSDVYVPQVSRGDFDVALAPVAEAVVPKQNEPYTELAASGPVLSGSGGGFSGWYEVSAPPPKTGYTIDTDQSSFYLSGDRKCGSWSECAWGERTPDKLSFRFRLQGHSEWPPPGQSVSQGFLKVVYHRGSTDSFSQPSRGFDTTLRANFKPLLNPFSGKVVQITTCPDREPMSFATSLAESLNSAGLAAKISTTPNACDATPIRIVARDNDLLKVLTDLLTQATHRGPLLQPDKTPYGSDDAAVIIGRVN